MPPPPLTREQKEIYIETEINGFPKDIKLEVLKLCVNDIGRNQINDRDMGSLMLMTNLKDATIDSIYTLLKKNDK